MAMGVYPNFAGGFPWPWRYIMSAVLCFERLPNLQDLRPPWCLQRSRLRVSRSVAQQGQGQRLHDVATLDALEDLVEPDAGARELRL